MLRAALWAWGRDFRNATRLAALAGQRIAFFLILFGVFRMFTGQLFGGLWLAFIGWFLQNAAAESWQQVAMRSILHGMQVAQVMNRIAPLVAPDLSVAALVNDYVLQQGQRYFFVADNGELAGMITLHNIRTLPQPTWPGTTVRQAMTPVEKLHCITPAHNLAEALDRMVAEDVNQLPVVEEGRLVGVVAREDLLRAFRVRTELGI